VKTRFPEDDDLPPLYKPLKAIPETAIWSGLDVEWHWRGTSITLWDGKELYGSIWLHTGTKKRGFRYSTYDQYGLGGSGKLASSLRGAVIGLNKQYQEKAGKKARYAVLDASLKIDDDDDD
jgi:hypothetical protein